MVQVDGFSLDAQKDRLRKYADYQEMHVAGEYCDEGKSGKNVEGRPEFLRMLHDIESGKDNVEELAAHSAKTIPTMMPFASAYFMPRTAGDRPDVVPKGSVNFAFLGNFAELPRDTVFTTEYSMRTAMVAVYTLMNVDRGVPEVWGSLYDVRDLLKATISMRDGRPLSEMKLGLKEKAAMHELLKKIHGTDIEKLLMEYHVIG